MPESPTRREFESGSKDEEITRGKYDYIEVLRLTHRWLRPSFYLEIGVRLGRSLSLANCPAIGVDPDFDIQFPLGPKTLLCREESDAFFAHRAGDVVPRSPGLVWLHLLEYALRDFINAEMHAHSASLIVVDDVSPNHPLQASRNRQTRVWTGDVWKLAVALREYRPDLTLILLDTKPSGLLFVAGLDPENRTLGDNYESLVSHFSPCSAPPQSIVDRRSTVDPDDEGIVHFRCLLNRLGCEDASSSQIQKAPRASRISAHINR